MPKQLKTLGEQVFSNCQKLREVTFSDGVESIGDYAFAGTNLNFLILPKSIRSLSDLMFREGDSVTCLYYMGSAEDWARVTGGQSERLASLVAFYSETQPQGSGRFWHWVDGIPTLW